MRVFSDGPGHVALATCLALACAGDDAGGGHGTGTDGADTTASGADTSAGETSTSGGTDGGTTTGAEVPCPETVLPARLAVCPGRGFYDAPTTVEIFSDPEDADIYLTFDGTVPTPGAGTPYTGPLTIAGTPERGVETLRAAAYVDGTRTTMVSTETYVFSAHVLTQPAAPEGFPASWGGGPGPQIEADYEMDPDVLGDPAAAARALAGLRGLPTISVVMDPFDLFDPDTGIYSNPSMEGIDWERPASAELIFPGGAPGLQADCGIRIQGGSSTIDWKSPKVSMRLFFRGEYGPGTFDFPLFADTPIESFDTLILDAHLNLTWIHPDHGQRVRGQYIRDLYVADLQNAAGSLAPHGAFVNLFVNGLYWGLIDLHERPDDSFSASYLGGTKDDYDAIKHNPQYVVAGDRMAWDAMMTLARVDLADDASYQELGGMLDLTDFADYMVVNIYAGNTDWPHQNWYAGRRRSPGSGWRFFSWDAEHVLKAVDDDVTEENDGDSPGELFVALRANAEFRLLVADRAHRLLFNGGPLYVDPAAPAWDPANPDRNRPAAQYARRLDEIDDAIVLESARWGDARRPDEPYTRDDEFLAERQWLLETYFPQRSAIVLDQLPDDGLYPDVIAPTLAQHGGPIAPGFSLTMSVPPAQAGAIHFTLDTTDPRTPLTGDVSPGAMTYASPVVIDPGTVVSARTRDGSTWSALTRASFE